MLLCCGGSACMCPAVLRLPAYSSMSAGALPHDPYLPWVPSTHPYTPSLSLFLPSQTDMLAWVHASLASEQEFLLSLFGDDSQQAALERQGSAAGASGGAAAAAAQAAVAAGQAEVSAAAGAAGSPPDGAPTIPQLLDSVFESICRPLRVRPTIATSRGACMQWSAVANFEGSAMIAWLHLGSPALHFSSFACPFRPLLPQVRIEQVLMSSPPPLLCFRLSQLLAFYLGTVEGLLGAGSQLAGACHFGREQKYCSLQLA